MQPRLATNLKKKKKVLTKWYTFLQQMGKFHPAIWVSRRHYAQLTSALPWGLLSMRFFLPVRIQPCLTSNKHDNDMDIGNVLCKLSDNKASIWLEDKNKFFYEQSQFHLFEWWKMYHALLQEQALTWHTEIWRSWHWIYTNLIPISF